MPYDLHVSVEENLQENREDLAVLPKVTMNYPNVLSEQEPPYLEEKGHELKWAVKSWGRKTNDRSILIADSVLPTPAAGKH